MSSVMSDLSSSDAPAAGGGMDKITADMSSSTLTEGASGDDVAAGPVSPDRDAWNTAELMELLEDFFVAPEFTSAVRAFHDEHDDSFEYTAEGEEQPLGNHAVYLKYTKLIEDLLERFLRQHGLDQEDISQLCQMERDSGNRTSFCLEYLLASTEYGSFVQMMHDFKGMKEFEVGDDDFAGLDCLGFNLHDAAGDEVEEETRGQTGPSEGAAGVS